MDQNFKKQEGDASNSQINTPCAKVGSILVPQISVAKLACTLLQLSCHP